MGAVWTHATWTVKPGREDEFARLWRALSVGVKDELGLGEALAPTLLRDRDRPNVFISFGPWETAAQIDAFRSSAAFVEYVGRMQPLLEHFERRTLDEATHDG